MQSREKLITPIIGRGEEMRALRALISTVADSQATVLISGESGTGKELIARALHDESDRGGGRFVPVNCAAIPRDLVEAELFGHRKGAFTGAVSDRVGRFELAHGGTLFLDEIGDLPLDIQVKLLRVLQERSIDPVGATKSVDVDVRVVAASHKDLEAEVKAGRFREDLFYRLNVLPLQSPPLRRRADDIPDLVDFHAKRLAPKGRSPIRFSPDMMLALKSYNWPGNVRELINIVDRFTALFPAQDIGLRTVPAAMLPKGLAVLRDELFGQLAASNVMELFPEPPEAVQAAMDAGNNADDGRFDDDSSVQDIIMLAQGMDELPTQGIPLKQRLAEIERNYISQALELSEGNVSKTAKLLSLQRTTLIEKINKYELRVA
ncbi:sigma-54 dependent transcriptional regulator [Burkholderiaceae bacterium]|jgi:sigma-54 specific flagellar transcriptional regulator A|nr:sigma-54 dependent transcriptional regulator [Betaproteobacteria bacterium]MDA8600663.1 sigma-54 dependent transcriptional regulator [Burkholderiaceae bacterium]MDC1458557.1 sigma-54 dependent transcriptional regulator [Burkholderiaceae bacterium]